MDSQIAGPQVKNLYVKLKGLLCYRFILFQSHVFASRPPTKLASGGVLEH